MSTLIYRLFDLCIKEIRDCRFESAHKILLEISKNQMGPQSELLFNRLKMLVSLSEIQSEEVSLIEQHDFGVILLMTEGNAEALGRSIDSIVRARANLGQTFHCLLFESLDSSINVNELPNQEVQLLPDNVLCAIEKGVINYAVDYGTRRVGLRRAVRCSRGRLICLLREGDELWVTEDAKKLVKRKLEVVVGVPTGSASDRNLFSTNFGAPDCLRALPTLLAASIVYDGALFFDRDYLDDLLGVVDYDGDICYFGYLNEVLTLAIAGKSARITISGDIGCTPTSNNQANHIDRIFNYTLYTIAERRTIMRGSLEKATDLLVDSILEVGRGALFGKNEHSIPSRSHVDELRATQAGEISSLAKQWVYWFAHQLRAVVLGDSLLELESPLVPTVNTDKPVVSFITSVFRGENLIHSFISNITQQTIFPKGELIIVSPEPNFIQDLVCEIFSLASSRVRVRYLSTDPGIYECWNIAIREARGSFLSNANLDDRRDPEHASRLVELLEYSGASVASSAVTITHDIREISKSAGYFANSFKDTDREIWFGDTVKSDGYLGLTDFFKLGDSGDVIQCMNFPHCMPVWRMKLHQRYGYFNENENGTYADFAYWLQAASSGERFVHLNEPLGLYYVDPKSHNRRNAKKLVWQEIVKKYLPKEKSINVPIHVDHSLHKDQTGNNIASSEVRLNFGNQILQNFGTHRSGWSYVLAGLSEFHDPSASTYCDTFIEKKFVWGGDPGDGGIGPVVPYDKPWIGFVHVPPLVPSWFQSEQSNQSIFLLRSWQESIEHCKGLFVLTDYHRRYLEQTLKKIIPISVLRHPTEFPEKCFNFDRYLENKKKRVVQVGWWLRKLTAISHISTPEHIPTVLGNNDWVKSLLTYAEERTTRRGYGSSKLDSLGFLSNDEYDDLLSENLVFLDFYDTSANNAVIECIARGTPIIVCRHPAVEEYLGVDYPLYYNDYSEIPKLLQDRKRVYESSIWLCQEEIRKPLRIADFLKSFKSSEVIRGLR